MFQASRSPSLSLLTLRLSQCRLSAFFSHGNGYGSSLRPPIWKIFRLEMVATTSSSFFALALAAEAVEAAKRSLAALRVSLAATQRRSVMRRRPMALPVTGGSIGVAGERRAEVDDALSAQRLAPPQVVRAMGARKAVRGDAPRRHAPLALAVGDGLEDPMGAWGARGCV